ncbi:MAG: hypothetical protein MZV65_00895 [Chromatiales bacterium]|nr:hypothetical protein [Chromatiales bacterium]
MPAVLESLGTPAGHRSSRRSPSLPAPIQAAIAAMTLTGVAAALLAVNFTAVTTALASMATGLTLVALAALQAFVAQLGAALTAARALWAVLLANPLTVLVGVLAVATAGWLAYRSASEETRESLAKSREETAKQIDELNTLRATLATAKPGTDAYTEAERKLAQVVPGLTLSLNEQGLIVARVGQGFEDNAKKVEEFAQVAGANRSERPAAATGAHRPGATGGRADKTEQPTASACVCQLRRHRRGAHGGAGVPCWSCSTRWACSMGYNQKSADLNAELRNQATLFRQLAIEALDSGMSIEEIEKRLRSATSAPSDIKRVVEQTEGAQGRGQLGPDRPDRQPARRRRGRARLGQCHQVRAQGRG